MICVGGLDPGGGAGLLRDFVSATALGACAVVVPTAWTVQAEDGVTGIEPAGPEALARSLARLVATPYDGATAVKIGMVATGPLAAAIIAGLQDFQGPIVFDPVLSASAGGSLFLGPTPERSLQALWQRATLVTPNLAEASALTGLATGNLAEATAAGQRLIALGACAVLVKGGHLLGEATDVLVTSHAIKTFVGPRIIGPSPRGTGCALAVALAVFLASGLDLRGAIAAAKAWLRERIAEARPVNGQWHLGP